MQRGRSRLVSRAAIARQASEERRLLAIASAASAATSDDYIAVPDSNSCPSTPSLPGSRSISPMTSATTSESLSPSPPHEPQSLQDQLHTAYALDDLQLAKIIFLKLKGISVTSANDPRIAAVQPEDFDECFLPNGGLMSGKDDWGRVEEMQRRENEKLEKQRLISEQQRVKDRRETWERSTSEKWEGSKHSLRAARIACWQKQKMEADILEEQELQRLQRRQQRHIPQRAPKLSYANMSTVRSSTVRMLDPAPTYICMPIPRRQVLPTNRSIPSTSNIASTRTETPSDLFPLSDPVPFKEVIKSMNGPLFPPEPSARDTSSRSTHKSPSITPRREAELVNAMLQLIKWEDGERARRKGKGRERIIPIRRDSDRSSTSTCSTCASLSSPSTTSSTSSGRMSKRTNSWFSMASASTAITSPSNSLPSPSISAWFKPSVLLSPPLQRTSSASYCCRHRPFSRLTPINFDDGPLAFPVETTTISPTIESTDLFFSSNSYPTTKNLIKGFVDLAFSFQNAYVGAVVFAAIPHTSLSEPDHVPNPKRSLQPPGSRASSKLVVQFVGAPAELEDSADLISIPLTSPFPPRTALTYPLPYPIVFKPSQPPVLSPIRRLVVQALSTPATSDSVCSSPRHTTSASHRPIRSISPTRHDQIIRPRTIENPAYLRVKALHNVVLERGVDGKQEYKIREKIVSWVCDNVGKSMLARGVSVDSYMNGP